MPDRLLGHMVSVAFCGREALSRGELGVILLTLGSVENRRRELLA